jgi:hypothetical protein
MPKNYLNLLLFIFLFQTTAYSNNPVVVKDTVQNLKTVKKSILKIDPNKPVSITKSEFAPLFIKENYPVSQENNKNVKTAKALFKTIDSLKTFVENLEPTSLSSLPIGINKTIGTTSYTLGISNAKFTPEYTEFTAFVRIIIPQGDENGQMKELFFGANNIKLSHKGGLVGDTNLVLLGDFPIKLAGGNSLLVLKGGMDMQTGFIENKTYVTIDCSGFKELGITADIEFSRNIMEPVGADNKPIPGDQRVRASFKTVVSNWNDILAEVTLPKFQSPKFKDFIFEVNNAVFDFSDIRNSNNITWPKDYQKDFLVPGNENLWKGLYVNSLKIILPEHFKKKNSNDRITFEAKDLLVDNVGVSGNFSGSNIISLEEGNASGWQFSLESIQIGLRASSVVSAGFGGKVILPISGATSQCAGATNELGYTATINPIDNEYTLKASISNNLCFQLFKAKATILPNSYFEFKVADGKFLPKAVLNGNIDISGSNSQDPNDTKKTVDFKGIEFQEFTLQTVSPYISAKYFGYKGEVSVGNFPVTISNIGLTCSDNSASLGFNLAVNLANEKFNGETRLQIVGKFLEEAGIRKWKFDHLHFSEITLGADIGGAKFSGSITLMENDPEFGDGFGGSLSAEFKGGITVVAEAKFGKKDNFRYWYVDAMVDNLNIKISPALQIKGFGGGAYSNMKKVVNGPPNTASGLRYVPDSGTGLGIKAVLNFANTAAPKAFWGSAGFEIAFNNTGGLNRISIYGEGHVMQNFALDIPGGGLVSKLQKVTSMELEIPKISLDNLKLNNLVEAAKKAYPAAEKVEGQSGMNAYAAIEYDFTKNTLHGTFDLYVDLVGGLFKGIGEKNKAGWADLYFGPDDWHVLIGTPEKRIGLKMGIGSFNIQSSSYIMIGKNLPGSPPPPAKVSEILGVSAASLNYMRDENQLKSGAGFAFGSDFSFSTGHMTFLIFYAEFNAGLGFDIMIKDYGNAQCEGSGRIGIDGWYANGQAYAYLQGDLGLEVRLFGRTRKLSIISAGAAVVLQAKLPNPVWVKGILGGNYSLLGGLVKGSFKFEMEFGSKCKLINANPLGGIKVIANVTPTNNASKVDVFTTPQVAFNLAVGRQFNLDTDDEGGGIKTYRIKMEELTVKNEAGVPVVGNVTWNSDLNLASFNSFDILSPLTKLKLTATVSFQEWKNNSWITVYDENGGVASETEVRTFTTGDAPDYIPEANVAYAYPVFAQKYFYKEESPTAYVSLTKGQPYLFDPKPGKSQKVIFKTGATQANSTLSYDASTKRVTMPLPSLQNSKSYKITLVTSNPVVDANSNIKETFDTKALSDSLSVDVKNNKLEATLAAGDIKLLEYNFNTSQYNTFANKMVAKVSTGSITEIIAADIHALQSVNRVTEEFDGVEVLGARTTENIPLIASEATLEDNYYKNNIFPMIYKGYPLEPEFIFNRDTTLLGVAPAKAIDVLSWYAIDFISYQTDPDLKTYLPYRYNLPIYYKSDFLSLRDQVINKYVNTGNSSMAQKYNYIISGQFIPIQMGVYKVKFTYRLPGGQVGTNFNFSYNNRF